GALWFQFCAEPGFFRVLFLHVVTKPAPVGARRLRWEVLLILSGAALAAASEGLFVFVHSGFRDKNFPCGGATQGIK
ncbi:hypothetical protein, partial [Salmonella enterica]|uniref:hypothetical protein n=1 Tax=Salmonella enterica TaxID=28901 RepID=UPI001C6398AE